MTGTQRPAHGSPVGDSACWLDMSDWSVLVVCEQCAYQSLEFDIDQAIAAAQRHHDLTHPGIAPMSQAQARHQQPCAIEGCDREQRRNGLCNTHSIAAHRAAKRKAAA